MPVKEEYPNIEEFEAERPITSSGNAATLVSWTLTFATDFDSLAWSLRTFKIAAIAGRKEYRKEK